MFNRLCFKQHNLLLSIFFTGVKRFDELREKYGDIFRINVVYNYFVML